MTDAGQSRGARDRRSQQGNGADDDLSPLRSLLLGKEQERISQLERRLDDPEVRAADIGQVLPQAVRTRMSQDDQLTKALAPTIEESFQVSVKRHPQVLVDIISPIMGPAIRTSIALAINGMVQSLNHTLEQSFSKQGLKWRLEAMRTGKPLAEVVLIHTLVYQVEQVFLIHRETGLLLHHVSAGAEETADADMMSGMLTAIQDFVHDSFGGDRDEGVNAMQVGERAVWIERGPHAVIACVIRGSAPEATRVTLLEMLENIHLDMREPLDSFSGDAEAFEATRPYLEECLQSQFKSGREGLEPDVVESDEPGRRSLVPWIILGAVAILGLHWGYGVWDEQSRWSAYLSRLRAEPGIVVVEARKIDDGYFVSGLRDPLASKPEALLGELGFTTDDVLSSWEPYLSFVPEFVSHRSRQLLKPPDTVELILEGDVLYAIGSARHRWIEQASRLVAILPGVSSFDLADLADRDSADFALMRSEVESVVVLFGPGSTAIEGHHRVQLASIAGKLAGLLSLGELLDRQFQIKVVGYADPSGPAELNLELSESRASAVRQELLNAGVPADRIVAEGAGALSLPTAVQALALTNGRVVRIKIIKHPS